MDIAIIGMAGRFPQARTIQEFYKNLCEGRDSIQEISLKRKIATGLPLSKDYQCAGFLEDIDQFDYRFFNFSLGEALHMDPQQRLLCEVVHHIFDDAGYSTDYFRGKNVAVFVGDTDSTYRPLIKENSLTVVTGNMGAVVAGRIARLFDLRGSASMIDTACSSSLTALHYACLQLAAGDADYALVCGVSVLVSLYEKNVGTDWGISSPDGRARSFTADANGSVYGETVSGVLLKPLAQAIKDGDIIHAVVKGTATNQDAARSGSLAAPDSHAQSEVIRKAWKNANIDPATIGYIETHGSGTKLGDPIEIQGITKAFDGFTDKRQFCAVSTVKSNIGHTGPAAGMAGLIKAVLSVKNHKLFPSVHFNNNPNPFIDFENSPVYVSSVLEDWNPGGQDVRRAGVSSFGLSGTNCHVVLEEYRQAGITAISPDSQENELLVISAQSEKSLKKNIREMSRFITEHPQLPLANIGHTLMGGRKYHPYRFAASGNRAAVLQQLQAAADNVASFAASPQPEKIVLVFSDREETPAPLMQAFCHQYPSFEEAYQRCLAGYTGAPEDEPFLRFAFRYSFFHLLQARGIKSKYFIGDGAGKIAMNVIAKKISLEEALQMLQRADTALEAPSDDASLESRLAAFIAKNAPERTLFLEVGLAGNISRTLQSLCDRYSDHQVVALPAGAVDKPFSQYLEAVFLSGYNNVLNYSCKGDIQKTLLPGYQFNSVRCWIEDDNEELKDWLYKIEWQKADLSEGEEMMPAGKVIVFCEASMAEHLPDDDVNNERIIKVFKDSFYSHEAGTNVFWLNWGSPVDYIRLFDTLQERGEAIAEIVHLGNCGSPRLTSANTDGVLAGGLFSLLYLVKAFDRYLYEHNVLLTVITENARKILAGDEVNANGATLHGFVSGLIEEYPRLDVKCIDVEKGTTGLFSIIAAERRCNDRKVFAGYRNGDRYLMNVLPIDFQEQTGRPEHQFMDGQTYILTGGTSGIGMEICRFLGEQHSLQLIVLGRRQLNGPDGEEARRLFAALEARGTKVCYYPVHLENRQEMETVFQDIRNRFPRVNGIIHAAGLPGKQLICHHSVDTFREALLPKVYGTIHLRELSTGLLDGPFLFFSSHSAIVGAEESSGYSAANIFLDEYVHELRADNIPALAINWPVLKDTGMWYRFQTKHNLKTDNDGALSNHQALRLFELVASLPYTNVVISKYDPNGLGENPFFNTHAEHGALRGFGGVPVNIRYRKKELVDLSAAPVVHADWSRTENLVARIWSDILKIKIKDLRRKDDFFEIGGHSLNGTQVINRLDRDLGVKITFGDLFDSPMLKDLAKKIDALTGDSQPQNNSLSQQGDIIPVAASDYYDVSYGQQRLWLLHMMDPQETAYNIQLSCVIDGPLERALFEETVNRIVERHEILRTSFHMVDRQLKQRVHPVGAVQVPVKFYDLKGDAGAYKTSEKLIEEDVFTPFDLKLCPLVRILLTQLEEKQFIFSITIHHIISDAWSIDVLFREIATCYNALLKGETDPLEPLDFQYRDYAHWQHQQLSGDGMKKEAAYWLQQLSRPLPRLALPAGKERPLRRTYNGDVVQDEINGQLLSSLRNITQKQDATSFMTYLALINLLLYKSSGQTDIIVGGPVSGRSHHGLEKQLGYYSNTIAFRSKINEHGSFESLLEQAKATVIDAYSHQNYPFDKLVDILKLERDVSHSPLFDITLVYQFEKKDSAEALGELKVRPFEIGKTESQFDLSFQIFEAGDSTKVYIKYNPDIYPQEYAMQLLARFKMIVRSVTASPETPVCEIPFLTKGEMDMLVHRFNDTGAPLPEQTLVALFEQTVADMPGNVAVTDKGQHFTFRELNERINRLAGYLYDTCSVRRGDRVGVLLDRSVSMQVALMAILKTGAAYVPVDPECPEGRLLYLLSHAGVKVLITDQDVSLNSSERTVVHLKDDTGAGYSTDNPGYEVFLHDLAYIMYTPEPAGVTKGVMIEHRSIVNRINWMWRHFDFDHSDVVLQKAGYIFDAAVWELFLPLCFGARMVIAGNDVADDAAAVLDLVVKTRVTAMQFTPSMLRLLPEEIQQAKRSFPVSLKRIFTAGAAPEVSVVRNYYTVSEVPLYHLNGYTETAGDVNWYTTQASGGIMPIGSPVDNCQLYILDDHLLPVPVGVAGQLAVGGICLARGYWNNEALTAARFVPNPFVPGERLYLTGDICCRQKNGDILPAGGKDAPAAGELHSGLVDRPAEETRTLTPLEQELRAIWQEVLGLSDIGVTENFFHLGGHSLSATQVIVRIQEQLNIETELFTIFKFPTIAQLAHSIAENDQTAKASEKEDTKKPLYTFKI